MSFKVLSDYSDCRILNQIYVESINSKLWSNYKPQTASTQLLNTNLDATESFLIFCPSSVIIYVSSFTFYYLQKHCLYFAKSLMQFCFRYRRYKTNLLKRVEAALWSDKTKLRIFWESHCQY